MDKHVSLFGAQMYDGGYDLGIRVWETIGSSGPKRLGQIILLRLESAVGTLRHHPPDTGDNGHF